MKATSNVNLELGGSDIEVSIYSAVDSETGFKQISNCCGTSVNYKKVCSGCKKELEASDISKAVEISKGEYKKVDADAVKLENSDLKVLGVANENYENGMFPNGSVWFIGIQVDKKKSERTLKNLSKFAHLREALRESNKSLIGAIRSRGKEHIVLLKPYFKGLLGVGLNYFENVRDIKEIEGYSIDCQLNKDAVSKMAQSLSSKTDVSFKDISNKREKIIEEMVLAEGNEVAVKKDKEVEVDVQELVNF